MNFLRPLANVTLKNPSLYQQIHLKNPCLYQQIRGAAGGGKKGAKGGGSKPKKVSNSHILLTLFLMKSF